MHDRELYPRILGVTPPVTGSTSAPPSISTARDWTSTYTKAGRAEKITRLIVRLMTVRTLSLFSVLRISLKTRSFSFDISGTIPAAHGKRKYRGRSVRL